MAANPTSLAITAMFASPLMVTEIPEMSAVNEELLELLLARENDEYRSRRRTSYVTPGVFESEPGLFQWADKPMQTLRDYVAAIATRVIAELSGFAREELPRVLVMDHSRFYVMRKGGSLLAHNYPMASWSATYCVRTSLPTREQPDSGAMRILEPASGSNMFLDAGNMRLRTPFGFGQISIRPTTGQLVLCPAHLMREVTSYFGDEPRITIESGLSFSMAPNQAPATPPN